MNYDESQKLSTFFIQRLKGLRYGQYIRNNNTNILSDYPFDIILFTFKICRPQIIYILTHKDFKDERHKVNYIMKIVESNINDVQNRVNNAKKSSNKITELEQDNLGYEGASYTKKTKEKKNDRLDKLW